MFILNKGELEMDNLDLDHIIGLIKEEGCTPKQALEKELSFNGLDIRNVSTINLRGSQMRNKEYCDVYAQIVCEFWNNKK